MNSRSGRREQSGRCNGFRLVVIVSELLHFAFASDRERWRECGNSFLRNEVILSNVFEIFCLVGI